MKAVWITTADLDHVRDTEMQRELARLERLVRIYTLCAMRFPVTPEGCWPSYRLPSGRVTTGFLPHPESELAAELTTADLDRIETQMEAA